MPTIQLTRRRFLQAVGAGSAALALGDDLLAREKRKPNIVLILADDLGYAGVGVQGCKDIPTPNIDSIAANGVRFTSGYVSCPVCSPTRAGLLTGRYQQRFGLEFNPGPPATAAEDFGLPNTETTLAALLKKSGYATGMVGKWHLGYQPQFNPQKRGFDEFFGFLAGAHDYLVSKDPRVGPILRGTEEADEKEYLTDAFGREAVSFIERHKNKPFFLYLSFNAVHSPLQASRKYLDRFSGISDEKRRTHAAMLSAMDDQIGNVIKAIRKNGIEEDTLIIFLSDNGGPTPGNTSSNLPMRGFKGEVYEGGIRVPFMMQWKNKLPAGMVSDVPVISLDLVPTALAAAGAKIEAGRFDGHNLLSYLIGKMNIPREALYWRYGEQRAVRKDGWKLVKTRKNGTELFDLSSDISESTNLAESKPEKLRELDQLLAAWESQMIEPRWRPRSGARGGKAEN